MQNSGLEIVAGLTRPLTLYPDIFSLFSDHSLSLSFESKVFQQSQIHYSASVLYLTQRSLC